MSNLKASTFKLIHLFIFQELLYGYFFNALDGSSVIPLSHPSHWSKHHIHQHFLFLFNHSVMSDSLWPHGLQHSRFLCPSPSPRTCSNSSIELVMQSNHLTFYCTLLFLLSVFPRIRVFSNESVLCIRWPKYWSFSFSISPSNEYSGLISFRIDWFGLLAVQRTLKSLLQHCSSKVSILQYSAFFMVQLSHPYMTTRKTITLIRQTFVGKVMSLLINMLSRLVIAFLPRSKHLLISWLWSPPAVILEPRKIKPVIVSIVSPSFCHELNGLDAMIFIFWMLSFKTAFSLSFFTFIERVFSSSLLSAISQLFHSLFSLSLRGSLVPLHFLQ